MTQEAYSDQGASRIMRAVLTLTMAGSTSSETDVAIDAAEVAAVSGEPLEDVNAALDELVATGAADAL